MNMQIDTLSEQIQDMRQKTAAAISENDERETEIEDIDKSKRWYFTNTASISSTSFHNIVG